MATRPLAEPRSFAAWLRSLFRHDWVVYAKPPFGGPEHALRYLSGYTHRVAISNRRLVALEQGNVTFRWRDSAHANKQRLLTLPVDEFLRRFLLHLLPRSFMRIRNFGFLANRRRASLLPLCFHLLAGSADISARTASHDTDHSLLVHPLELSRSAEAPCTWWNGSPQLNFSYVLHHSLTYVPHEPATPASIYLHASACAPPLCLIETVARAKTTSTTICGCLKTTHIRIVHGRNPTTQPGTPALPLRTPQQSSQKNMTGSPLDGFFKFVESELPRESVANSCRNVRPRIRFPQHFVLGVTPRSSAIQKLSRYCRFPVTKRWVGTQLIQHGSHLHQRCTLGGHLMRNSFSSDRLMVSTP